MFRAERLAAQRADRPLSCAEFSNPVVQFIHLGPQGGILGAQFGLLFTRLLDLFLQKAALGQAYFRLLQRHFSGCQLLPVPGRGSGLAAKG